LIHKFEHDFYGESLKVIVLGYLRPELNFPSLGSACVSLSASHDPEALIAAIHGDIQQAKDGLSTADAQVYKSDPFFAS
jgi:FAD synthase